MDVIPWHNVVHYLVGHNVVIFCIVRCVMKSVGRNMADREVVMCVLVHYGRKKQLNVCSYPWNLYCGRVGTVDDSTARKWFCRFKFGGTNIEVKCWSGYQSTIDEALFHSVDGYPSASTCHPSTGTCHPTPPSTGTCQPTLPVLALVNPLPVPALVSPVPALVSLLSVPALVSTSTCQPTFSTGTCQYQYLSAHSQY